MPKQVKLSPADIVEWLHNCIMEVEADGYQQNEDSDDAWRVSGPPEIVYLIEGKMLVRTPGGEVFNVKVTRARKPADA